MVALHLYSLEWDTSSELNTIDLLNSKPDTSRISTMISSVAELTILIPIPSYQSIVGEVSRREDLVAIHVSVNCLPFCGVLEEVLTLTERALSSSTVRPY